MAEFKVLSKVPFAAMNEKRELERVTFCVYQDEKGQVGTIVIRKEKFTDDDVRRAIKERRGPA